MPKHKCNGRIRDITIYLRYRSVLTPPSNTDDQLYTSPLGGREVDVRTTNRHGPRGPCDVRTPHRLCRGQRAGRCPDYQQGYGRTIRGPGPSRTRLTVWRDEGSYLGFNGQIGRRRVMGPLELKLLLGAHASRTPASSSLARFWLWWSHCYSVESLLDARSLLDAFAFSSTAPRSIYL
jgi:hypothetical protein